MKKALICIVTIFTLPITGYTQDVIYKINKQEIKAKVLEVNVQDIKYKNFSNLEGPIYSINKNEVLMILYQNGTSEVIGGQPMVTSQDSAVNFKKLAEKDAFQNKYGKNMFSINLFPLVFGCININYERFFAKQKLSIKIPIYLGYNTLNTSEGGPSKIEYFPFSYTGNSYYNLKQSLTKGFAGGIHLKYFPTGEGKVRGFFDAGIEIGTFQMEYTYQNFQYEYVSSYSYNDIFFIINGGTIFQISKTISSSIDLGLSISENDTDIGIRIGTSLGFRF